MLRHRLPISHRESENVSQNSAEASVRPDWVKDAQNASSSGSLVVVTRSDGTTAGFHMSRTSLVEQASRDRLQMANTGI